MLRRTQARQVVPVYHQFMDRFPTIDALAGADDEEVGRVLRPLGLRWRVPAFRQLASAILRSHGGRIPEERHTLLTLPGVGEYVADAVRCFAFDRPAALIDTNTVRLAGRFLGFPHSGDVRRRRDVRTAITSLVGEENTRNVNLAMIDHAALVCRPETPRCACCPLASKCSWVEIFRGP